MYLQMIIVKNDNFFILKKYPWTTTSETIDYLLSNGRASFFELFTPPTPRVHVTDRRPGCVESILVLAVS